ncbi:MAG: hypothetical protein U0X20_11690 [Caldilineaceae bacterium]
MESITVSPNGAGGADAAHSLADPAAERMLDTILATPFAEVDPPADLPPDLPVPDAEPAADPAAEPSTEPPAEEPPSLPEGMGLFLPEDVTATEPDTDPAADPAATEAEAPAAEAQPEPEAPAEPIAEPDAQLDEDPDDAPTAPPAADRPWQVGDFAVYKDKYVIEITKIFPASELGPANFSGHAIYVQKEDNSLTAGKPIVVRPLSALTPITKVTTLLKLKIGLELRETAEHDRIALAHAKAAEQLKAQLEAYVTAKKAIADLMPDTLGLTW